MNENPKKIAFMDTNALLRMFIFWEACELADTAMVDVKDWKELRASLTKQNIPILDQFNESEFRYIQNGLKCFEALHKANLDYDFFSCQVCRAEMHRVILSSHAHERLHRHRVPLSLQQIRPLILHRRVLYDSDYQRIDQQIDRFFCTLRFTYNIDIKNVEDEAHGDDTSVEEIFSIARAVWSRILTGTMDAYIYAAAVACQADCFLTSDDALRETANKFSNPDNEWKEVAEALRQKLGRPETSKFPAGCHLNITLP